MEVFQGKNKTNIFDITRMASIFSHFIFSDSPQNSINDEKRKKSFRCCSRGRGRCNKSSEFFHEKIGIQYHIIIFMIHQSILYFKLLLLYIKFDD